MKDLKEKAYFYFNHKISVHIKTHNLKYYSGLILEISDSHIILKDRYLDTVFLPFSEIWTMEKFKGEEE
ncbi:MAG TPA: hypothetical protein VMZ91_15980 [Candidatus Paceibacterota bacterium]|nr:hypothetical protein [Candidatus Paceibacterota bacterium]